MPPDECSGTLLTVRQHCFRLWLGTVRQQVITSTNIDQDLCRHMASLCLNGLRILWTPKLPLLVLSGSLVDSSSGGENPRSSYCKLHTDISSIGRLLFMRYASLTLISAWQREEPSLAILANPCHIMTLSFVWDNASQGIWKSVEFWKNKQTNKKMLLSNKLNILHF